MDAKRSTLRVFFLYFAFTSLCANRFLDAIYALTETEYSGHHRFQFVSEFFALFSVFMGVVHFSFTFFVSYPIA